MPETPDPPHPEGRRGWLWVPSLYFAESIPNAVVSDTAGFFYADFGQTPEMIGSITGLMYLPWVIKPLWSPLVELVKSKRWWIVLMQLSLAAVFSCLAVATQGTSWLVWSAVCLWSMAAISATHDIAADGFYMLGLPERYQAAFNGIRNTAYKLGMLCGKGALLSVVALAATQLHKPESWSVAFLVPAVFFLFAAGYHAFVLPRPDTDRPGTSENFATGYLETFRTFFAKPNIGAALAFMLLYRLPEVQMLPMVPVFLKSEHDKGGLGLSIGQAGLAYGTVGVAGLFCGGILAGLVVARYGIRPTYWPLVLATHLPNIAFLLLAMIQPTSFAAIQACLFVEQFGYGFGFTAFTLYLMYFSRGPQRTAHYAICTGFMALTIMVGKVASGFLKAALGFKMFYVYILVCTIPSLVVSWLAWRDDEFLEYFPPSRDA